ncbi:hypothetical protein HN51_068953 [Arachis hypogaea]|nr:uncharacterized protein DS421_15g495400 [Arachis hypogaea]
MKYAGKNPKAKDAGKNRKANRESFLEWKESRKSFFESKKSRKFVSSGLSGSSKKGGHGEKFTWIGGQDYWQMEIDLVALDANDPNFDDPEDY